MPTSNFSLFKKNGYYYTRFTVDGKRKQRSTRTTNKAEALKALGETDPPRFPKTKTDIADRRCVSETSPAWQRKTVS